MGNEYELVTREEELAAIYDEATRKRDAEIAALRAERDAAVAALQLSYGALGKAATLRAERDAAVRLAHEMWLNADGWAGPRASSHYRSEISERLAALKGGG